MAGPEQNQALTRPGFSASLEGLGSDGVGDRM